MPTVLAYKEVPNISFELIDLLNEVGIYTVEDLQAVGGKEAFLKIRHKIKERPFHTLCSLVATCRWQYKNELDQKTRQELRFFFEELEAKDKAEKEANAENA
jgi:hypothetical protein